MLKYKVYRYIRQYATSGDTYLMDLLVPCCAVCCCTPNSVRGCIGIHPTTRFAIRLHALDAASVSVGFGELMLGVRTREVVEIILGEGNIDSAVNAM